MSAVAKPAAALASRAPPPTSPSATPSPLDPSAFVATINAAIQRQGELIQQSNQRQQQALDTIIQLQRAALERQKAATAAQARAAPWWEVGGRSCFHVYFCVTLLLKF